jgi:hypothetical protein
MLTGGDSVLRLPAGPLFVTQMIYEYEELRWNDIDRGNRKLWEETTEVYFYVLNICV